MASPQPEFLYVTLILPSLFALTLIAEGIHKIKEHKSGWMAIATGSIFLTIVVSVYFVMLR